MIIGNPIMAGASGPAASIFVTGLSETDTVTATKGSNTLTGKWTQKPNPALHGLPDGYTELEYIESTGTQYIDTGLKGDSSYTVTIKTALTEDTSGDSGWVMGSNAGAGYSLVLFNSTCADWRSASKGWSMTGIDSVQNVHTYELNVEYAKCDDISATYTNYSSYSPGSYNVLILASRVNTGSIFYAKCRMYMYRVAQGSTVIQDFIPARRNSDSAIGMYNLVSGTFFENSGTGEFVAGSEVPQTIDCYMLSPIRKLGTWTVTATDGTKTATQDVLVDVITNYEIEMSLST